MGIQAKFFEYQWKDPDAASPGPHFRRNGYQTAGFHKIANALEHENSCTELELYGHRLAARRIKDALAFTSPQG